MLRQIVRRSPLLALTLVACLFVVQAFAQTAGVDVTDNVQGFFDLFITVLAAAIITVVKMELPRLIGASLSANNLAALQAFLEQEGHSLVNAHLLEGRPIVVDTKSVLGNQLLASANQALPAQIQSLGLSADALAALAQGAVAKAINAMPSAPPYAPAASVPVQPQPAR